MTGARVWRHATPEHLAVTLARDFIELAGAAVRDRGRFTVALTGGSSPRRLYQLLSQPDMARQVPWQQVHLFWGDERVVPPEHPRSNFRMANALLVSRVPIPSANVHRIQGERPAVEAALRYEAALVRHFHGPPRFDLILLGLGEDGHVASLFPFDLPRLTERDRLVAPSLLRSLGERRVTLTPATINAAARVDFLVPSSDKDRIATVAMDGPLDPFRVPAQLVRPRNGELRWHLLQVHPSPRSHD